jgi:hypothetical protein
MAMVVTADTSDTEACASAFHIGDGFYVTARHVLEAREIKAFLPEAQGEAARIEETFLSDDGSDVAVLRTTCLDAPWMPPGTHYDDLINDEAFYLAPVLLMGYPPVPLSREPRLVAVSGEINAVIDRYDTRHPHFVVSPLPRGGFSGGPALVVWDFVLGIIAHELGMAQQDQPGFTAILSIEPLWQLLESHNLEVSTLDYG